MDVRILEYLIIIEQEKSISRAAEKIHISQSALSQCLSKIEKEVDSPIFVSVNRQLIPTPIGRIYLSGAREMLEIKNDVYQNIENLVNQPSSTIKIAVDVQMYQHLMKDILPSLQEEFPETQFEILVADSYLAKQYLLNHIADAGFLCAKEHSNSMLLFHPLYEEKLVLAVPENYLAKYENTPTTYEQFPFIYPQSGTYFRPIFDSILSKSRIMPDTYYEAEDLNSVKQLMEQGYGVTFLPERMTSPNASYKTYLLNPSYEYQTFFSVPKYSSSAPELERLYSIAQTIRNSTLEQLDHQLTL